MVFHWELLSTGAQQKRSELLAVTYLVCPRGLAYWDWTPERRDCASNHITPPLPIFPIPTPQITQYIQTGTAPIGLCEVRKKESNPNSVLLFSSHVLVFLFHFVCTSHPPFQWKSDQPPSCWVTSWQVNVWPKPVGETSATLTTTQIRR